MLITAIVLADAYRALVPAALLAAGQVAFSALSLAVDAVSWALPTKVYQGVDNAMYGAYLRNTLFVFENLSGVELHLYGDVDALERERESAIVFSNHQSNVDWAVIVMLAARGSREGGLRFIAKNAIIFAPLFGWYTFKRGYVYVRRFGQFAPSSVLAQFAFLRSLTDTFWLGMYPEGTRFNRRKPKKIEESTEFCRAQNLPVPDHTLTPRTGAFTLALAQLRGVGGVSCVYDFTIAYGLTRLPGRMGIAPGMFEFCCNGHPRNYNTVHVHISRFPLASLPTDPDAQKAWLRARFAKKDAMMAEFYATGRFPEPRLTPAPRLPLHRTFLPFVIFAIAGVLLPVVSRKVRIAYALTLAVSPLLVAQIYLRRMI